jgi:hypothetical protein
LIDPREGYEEALADTDDAMLTALFRDMIAMRERHQAQIAVNFSNSISCPATTAHLWLQYIAR